MPWLLAPAFLLIALLYAAVGFGGGSSYTALLALAGTDYRILPALSLICNIAVTTGGCWRFARAGHIPWRRAFPLVVIALPFAWIGGLLAIPQLWFIGLLGASLGVAGGLMLLYRPPLSVELEQGAGALQGYGLFAASACLGLLAGIVGIGGGIFLAPLLYLTHWGDSRSIAGTASLFIVGNSIAGLSGHYARLAGDAEAIAALISYWPLLPAVLIGGAIGSWLGAKKLPLIWMQRGTGLLILMVALRLIWLTISA
ncbi:sulfite exporter TauE/SafE family protein [Alterisphingorhabdus coralli]|uniref:Probable membrane transporter protein n=1 Tax=Alterisphingorhabdus coralli TaxID=3071408 RepID=A0AA97F6Q5_9SPHN|nr:sulfite exporter TauE/SafE family protein [Parasphingorhabdus sp. SCSIO 66989]WOE74956.1 sulfite exporter TauE/SafE family protein [Parasphingorhabdus sp. SCSIO 66989]